MTGVSSTVRVCEVTTAVGYAGRCSVPLLLMALGSKARMVQGRTQKHVTNVSSTVGTVIAVDMMGETLGNFGCAVPFAFSVPPMGRLIAFLRKSGTQEEVLSTCYVFFSCNDRNEREVIEVEVVQNPNQEDPL